MLGGVYDKSMYFLVPPFDLDSLSGSGAGAISFKGSFISSGLFPTFEEKTQNNQGKKRMSFGPFCRRDGI